MAGIDDLIDSIIGGSSDGGGSSGETWGEPYYDASLGKYVQRSSRGSIRILGAPAASAPAVDDSGYDPSTGLPYGVTRVPTTVSPTGLVYQGVPVNADGSPYTGATSGAPKYSGLKEGPGGLWGLNEGTGVYELIPGSEKLGSNPSPVSYSGGGFSIPRDYKGEIKAKSDADIASINAKAAASVSTANAQSASQKEVLAAQQAYDRETGALGRAFQAAQQAWQGGVTNRQLMLEDEAQKRAAANDFRSAVSDTDPQAFTGLMKAWGNIENALRGGATAVSDQSLAGAAALLDLIRRPYQPVPEFSWQEPGGAWVGGLAGSGAGGATGGAGGTGATGATGGATGGTSTASDGASGAVTGQRIVATPQEELFARLQNDFVAGYGRNPGPEEIAIMFNASRGQLPLDYSGGWQSIDPFAVNYRPPYEGYTIPGFSYNYGKGQLEPSGEMGRDIVVDVAAQTADTNQSQRLPGLARGGMARGAFIVGEGSRRNPSEHSELVIAPQGAHVVPLGRDRAKQLLNGGVRSYNDGTGFDFPIGADWENAIAQLEQYAQAPTAPPAAPVAAAAPTVAPVAPVVQPVAAPVQPAPVAAPVQTVQQPAPVAAPVTTATTTTATAPPVTTDTSVNGLVSYGGQTVTPDFQSLLDEIRTFREGVQYDKTINPMDVSFNNLDPYTQEVFYKGRQAQYGIPTVAQAWEQSRYRLPGLSRGQVGIGY